MFIASSNFYINSANKKYILRFNNNFKVQQYNLLSVTLIYLYMWYRVYKDITF